MTRAAVCFVVLSLVPVGPVGPVGLVAQQAVQSDGSTVTVTLPDGSQVVTSLQGGVIGGVQGGIVGGFVAPLQGPPPPPGPNGQPPRDTRPTTGNSRIRGRVLVADTGQPARRATVRVMAPEVRDARTTTTDVDGRYEIANLPPGRYSITASKNGFLSLSYGQTRPTGPPQTLTLADRQNADDVNLQVLRGGAIAGRVLDDFGDPVSGATVMSLRSQFQQGQQRLVPIGGTARTNDLGEYRLFTLTPGAYYVAATAPTVQQITVNGVTASADNDRSGFAPVFYPGTSDAAGATKITVAAGQTASDINLSLVGTRLAQITGTVVDASGGPVTAGGVSANSRGKVTGLPSINGQLKADGTFIISNVPPGSYTLRANIRPPIPRPMPGPGAVAAPLAPPGPPEWAVAVVTVSGDDVSGVRLAPMPRVTVKGRVMFSDPAAAASLKPAAIRVNTQVLNVEDNLIGPAAAGPPPSLKDDFSFELQVLPGLVMLRAMIMQAPGSTNPWVLKALRVNGSDRTDTGIEVRPNEDLDGVEIELTNRIAELSGTVSTAQGTAAANHTILLFPAERDLWTAPGPGRNSTTRSDSTGQFTFRNIRPGRYYALAVAELDASSWTDPENLLGLSAHATQFSITEGEKKTLDLRVTTIQP